MAGPRVVGQVGFLTYSSRNNVGMAQSVSRNKKSKLPHYWSARQVGGRNDNLSGALRRQSWASAALQAVAERIGKINPANAKF
jgi:hypothetical protein